MIEESSGYRDLGSEGIPKNTVYKTVIPINQGDSTSLHQTSLASQTSPLAGAIKKVYSSTAPKIIGIPNDMQLNSNHYRKHNVSFISPKALGGSNPVKPQKKETKHNPTLVMEEEKDDDDTED